MAKKGTAVCFYHVRGELHLLRGLALEESQSKSHLQNPMLEEVLRQGDNATVKGLGFRVDGFKKKKI